MVESPNLSKLGLADAVNGSLRMAPVDIVSSILTSSVGSSTFPSSPTLNLNSSSTTQQTPERDPLSVQATTINFKRFVSKCGPIFILQDHVEAILLWQDPFKTVFCGCLWACLCLYPVLLLVLPSCILISLLLLNHSERYPQLSTEVGLETAALTDEADQPIDLPEGSVDYIYNMQHIQNLMRDVSDLVDFVKKNVIPYLDWSYPQISIVLVHLSFLSTIVIYLVAPLIPWKFVLLIAGESILVSNHPTIKSWIDYLSAKVQQHPTLLPKLSAAIQHAMLNDALSDEVIESTKIIHLFCLEHQRYGEGGWSLHNLESRDPAPWVQQLAHHEQSAVPNLKSVTPPTGFQWIKSETWRIDYAWMGGDCREPIDAEGWIYLDHGSVGPSVRKRRWLRRAYSR